MSLKFVHVFFISISVILAFGFAFWGLRQYQASPEPVNLVLSVSAFVAGAALLFYLASFLKKMKRLP